MPDQHARRVLVRSVLVRPAVGSDNADAEITKLCEQHLTHQQIASETVGSFDEYEPHAVQADALEEVCETTMGIEIARAAHALVPVLADGLDAMGARVARDRGALAREAVALNLAAA